MATKSKEPYLKKSCRFVETEAAASGDEADHKEDSKHDKIGGKNIKGLISSEDVDPASENQRDFHRDMMEVEA